MDYTAANFEQAVQQFYCNGCLQQDVHSWLTKAQTSFEAWTFVWDLLQPEKRTEVLFYGASCLHVKISRYWHELSSSDYEGLKNKLLKKIIELANGPRMVLSRLCLSLASFVIQTLPDTWPNSVASLISTFSQQMFPNVSPLFLCQVLVQILTVLPEEFFSANLNQHKRGIIRNELTNAFKDVIPLLHKMMTASPNENKEVILRCFISWVDFGIPLIEAEPLIIMVFEMLHNDQLFDTAVEALSNMFSHPDSHRFPYTIQKLLPNILQLEPMFQKAIEEGNMDVCWGICRLVVSVAETHSKLILDSFINEEESHQQNFISLTKMVLACTSLPGHFPVNEVCSDMTFAFWYSLQDELVTLDSCHYTRLLPVFQPVYLKLIEILLVKVQYPSDEEYDSWSAEEKEHFRCYRHDIGDTMMYSFPVLRETIMNYLCSMLFSSIQVTQQGQSVQWQLIEGIFFLFGAISENIDLEENNYVPTLLNALPQIPLTHIKLISTTLSMVGSFGEWMNCHPESLRSVIPLLLQGLSNTDVATPATLALKDVTRETLDHLQPFASHILSSCQSVLEKKTMRPKEVVRLMATVGHVLSVLPFSEVMIYLDKILIPQIKEFNQLAKEGLSAAVKAAIIQKLDMLSWLMSTIISDKDSESEELERSHKQPTEPNPVIVIMQHLAPAIQTIVTRWSTDCRVVETLCELFRRALKALMDDFVPMAQDVVHILIQIYQGLPQPCILVLAKQILRALVPSYWRDVNLLLSADDPDASTSALDPCQGFGISGEEVEWLVDTMIILMFFTDESLKPVVKYLLVSLTDKSLVLFQTDFRNNTDVVEALLSLWSQILKKAKLLVIGEDSFNMAGLFQTAVGAVILPENLTVKAACAFLQEFVSLGTEFPGIRQVIISYGGLLVDHILLGIGGEAPREVLTQYADILLVLNKHHMEQLIQWLNEMTSKEHYPSPRATKEQKEQFTKALVRDRLNKRKIREAVKEFSLQCRGLYGTEYAAQWATKV